MRTITLILISILVAQIATAQGTSVSFMDYQRSLPRPADALKHKEDTLEKQFEAKGLHWPAKYIYIRSFKYDGQLEVWVKNERKEPYKLFKSYKVCALAGSLGPKRMAGDYQVPEGFYYINEFNPNSNYYLSLGLNYPNPSDKVLSDSLRPGGDIYIHGSCVTVGCIPVTDQQIEEIYILATYAKNAGEDYIPVHIFPIKYNNKRSAEYLATLTKNDNDLRLFSEKLEGVYEHFELTHQLPVIMTNSSGEYVYDGIAKKVPVIVQKPKHVFIPHRYRKITDLAEVVNQWPLFPGGQSSWSSFLSKIGKAMVPFLPDGEKKANVMIEFIVDVDGKPVNFKVLKGVNEEFDDELITVLEHMPDWKPAILGEKPVAKMMKQSFMIE